MVMASRTIHERYFRRRLEEELDLANRALDDRERAAHLRACRHYRAILFDDDLPRERTAKR